jgi:SRSO17 transposase
MNLPSGAFKEITWREGTRESCDPVLLPFASARRIAIMREPNLYAEEWLLIEWPRSEPEPTKYWLATLPPATQLKALVKMAKHQWIIERDYQELKQEFGLGHFEGRNWRGSTITPLCVSRLMGSWSPSGTVFPPLPAPVISDSLPRSPRAA